MGIVLRSLRRAPALSSTGGSAIPARAPSSLRSAPTDLSLAARGVEVLDAKGPRENFSEAGGGGGGGGWLWGSHTGGGGGGGLGDHAEEPLFAPSCGEGAPRSRRATAATSRAHWPTLQPQARPATQSSPASAQRSAAGSTSSSSSSAAASAATPVRSPDGRSEPLCMDVKAAPNGVATIEDRILRITGYYGYYPGYSGQKSKEKAARTLRRGQSARGLLRCAGLRDGRLAGRLKSAHSPPPRLL